MYALMEKFRARLAMWLYMGTRITDGSKKLLENTLSLIRLDDRQIATSFYGKRQEGVGRIGVCSYSQIY